MKKLMALFALCLSTTLALAQDTAARQPGTPPMEAPFKRFPSVPPFQILLPDSSGIYAKANLPSKKAVLFMIFSPECSHCQHETEELVKYKDKLEDVQVVMVTLPTYRLELVREFITKYGLNELPNVVVGRDHTWFFPSFFDIGNLPYLAMYNKKGDLIHHFEGNMGMRKVAEVFKKADR